MKQSPTVLLKAVQQFTELSPVAAFSIVFVIAFFMTASILAWKQVRYLPNMQPTKFIVGSAMVFLLVLFVFAFTTV